MNTLAEKMYEGFQITEPAKFVWLEFEGKKCFACAMGAALMACDDQTPSRLESSDYINRLEACTGIDMHQDVTSPVIELRSQLWSVIMSLNDESNWSRERIANWVSQLELT